MIISNNKIKNKLSKYSGDMLYERGDKIKYSLVKKVRGDSLNREAFARGGGEV
jgi:hypothetical protein